MLSSAVFNIEDIEDVEVSGLDETFGSYVKLHTIGNDSLPRVSHTLEVLSTGNKRSEVDSSCCLITALNKIIYLGSPGNVVTLL